MAATSLYRCKGSFKRQPLPIPDLPFPLFLWRKRAFPVSSSLSLSVFFSSLPLSPFPFPNTTSHLSSIYLAVVCSLPIIGPPVMVPLLSFYNMYLISFTPTLWVCGTSDPIWASRMNKSYSHFNYQEKKWGRNFSCTHVWAFLRLHVQPLKKKGRKGERKTTNQIWLYKILYEVKHYNELDS